MYRVKFWVLKFDGLLPRSWKTVCEMTSGAACDAGCLQGRLAEAHVSKKERFFAYVSPKVVYKSDYFPQTSDTPTSSSRPYVPKFDHFNRMILEAARSRNHDCGFGMWLKCLSPAKMISRTSLDKFCITGTYYSK